jgi:hypothetical protein
MTLETPATDVRALGRRLLIPACPHCNDVPIAPTTAAFAGRGKVRHVWACDTCGYAFQTRIRYGMGRRDSRLTLDA